MTLTLWTETRPNFGGCPKPGFPKYFIGAKIQGVGVGSAKVKLLDRETWLGFWQVACTLTAPAGHFALAHPNAIALNHPQIQQDPN